MYTMTFEKISVGNLKFDRPLGLSASGYQMMQERQIGPENQKARYLFCKELHPTFLKFLEGRF